MGRFYCADNRDSLRVSLAPFGMPAIELPVTGYDLAIVDRALEILDSQAQRNLNGDRNCVDDVERKRFSVFCALYVASIEVDDTYRHGRPALQAARSSFLRNFPGRYAHTLHDINNNDTMYITNRTHCV